MLSEGELRQVTFVNFIPSYPFSLDILEHLGASCPKLRRLQVLSPKLPALASLSSAQTMAC